MKNKIFKIRLDYRVIHKVKLHLLLLLIDCLIIISFPGPAAHMTSTLH